MRYFLVGFSTGTKCTGEQGLLPVRWMKRRHPGKKEFKEEITKVHKNATKENTRITSLYEFKDLDEYNDYETN